MVPFHTGGGEQAAFDVVDRFFVYCHQTGTCAAFDGHVAHRHAAFHAERTNRRASKLNGVARAAGGADFADDGQNHVFASDAFG